MSIRPHRAGSSTLKMSLKKQGKLDDPGMARMCYGVFCINGVQYCRPHLMLFCHLCEVDQVYLREECNQERMSLGLRMGGDAGLNERADRWADEIRDAQLVMQLKSDNLRVMNGGTIPPPEWQQFTAENKEGEREINDRFLADVGEIFRKGASQCCYWGCENPDADKLYSCTGCGVVKYCSREHQALDWKWEHKVECTKSVPQFILDEIESDRQRNLAGDYSEVKRS